MKPGPKRQRSSNYREKLRNSENLFRTVFEYVPDAGYIVDPTTGRLVDVNRQACLDLGYTREELLQLPVSVIDYEFATREEEKQFLDCPVIGKSASFEAIHHRKDGSTFPVVVNLSAIELDNKLYVLAFDRNLVERKKIEQNLRESEERYRLLSENATDMIVLNSPDGILQYVSPACRAVLGYEPEELIGHSMFEFHHPDEVANLHIEVDEALLRKGVTLTTLRFRCKDGHYCWLEASTRVVTDPVTGETPYTVGVARDISERKRYEQVLIDARRESEEILESIKDAFFALDKDARFIYANRKTEELWGKKREAIIGKFIWSEFPQLEGSDTKREILRVLAEQVPVEYETKSAVAHRWVEVNIYPKDGGVSVYFRDIEERKKSEEQLLFLSEVSKIINTSLDYEVTLQSLAHLLVPALADYCSVSVMEPDGTFHRQGIAHKDPALEMTLREMLEQYPSTGEQGNQDYKKLLSGKPVLVNNYKDIDLQTRARDAKHLDFMRQLNPRSRLVVPLLAKGQFTGMISLFSTTPGFYTESDFPLVGELASRAATAVDNARLYKEARQAIAIREDFLSIAAHELKTPLTSVRGFAQLALREFNKPVMDRERMLKALATIERQSQKQAFLINRLMDYSKIQSGGLVLDLRRTDLQALVENAVEMLQPVSNEHLFAVNFRGSVYAYVDLLRFDQVLTNLLENSLKYSPQGGIIEITLDKTSQNEARLSIKDQGVGISPEYRENIFDMFYQAHQDTYSGLGVGLYVSRQVVDMHGGRIEVEFPPEGGTCFIVTIPTGITE